ncbi:MAG TPA: sigma factor-like helix-turn-helix DNA-binding protein [Terracidiphilus sp.]|jgi:DNA-directed RNA polymerase specialized sigma24 family protein
MDSRGDRAYNVAADGHGMDIRSIARALGTSRGTVWNDLQSALKKLRRHKGFIEALREVARIDGSTRREEADNG